MTKAVRDARMAGLLPEIGLTEFAVLFIAADTCRGESRVASITVTELEKLTGLGRTTLWRAIKKLRDLGYVDNWRRGNKWAAQRFEVLPGARSTDATCTEGVHVASEGVHVAPEVGARCTGATYPVSSINPERQTPKPRAARNNRLDRKWARENCRDCDEDGISKAWPYDRCTHPRLDDAI